MQQLRTQKHFLGKNKENFQKKCINVCVCRKKAVILYPISENELITTIRRDARVVEEARLESV